MWERQASATKAANEVKHESEQETKLALNRLISGAMAGDRKNQAELLTRFRKMIYASCMLQLDERNQVEDVTQDICTQVIQDISRLKSPEAFVAWLQRIIGRSCARFNHQNKQLSQREQALSEIAPEFLEAQFIDSDLARNPEALYEREEADNLLMQCINKLPETQRIVIVLHYFGDLSYQRIAGLLHVQLGTVASNISKGKRNLMRDLARILLEA